MARETVRRNRPFGAWVLAGCMAVGSLAGFFGLGESQAQADQTTSYGSVSGKGKGIVGGALLGGEVVVDIEAIAGVQKFWPYAVGGVLGAAAGGVGGHFIEQNASPRVPLYMLAAGLALVVPSTVLALNATSYKPPPDYQEDKAPTGAEPVAEPPHPQTAPPSSQQPAPSSPSQNTNPGSSLPRAKRQRVASASRRIAPAVVIPSSVLDLSARGALRMGIPAVEVRPLYSLAEIKQFGVTQKEEVHIPVFHATF